ncbi:hypothetical protein TWF696_003600 [Orbilia brochopaga]|uniref:C3H1-type domain-containing protein n=1 Tax=Orbilia brochopaga TaxID=3140254 RepID=A0AAV9TZR9_9PEZI
MFPVPFNSSNVYAARDQLSTGSGPSFISAAHGRLDTSKTRPVNKTSRFASLFQQAEASTDAAVKATDEIQTEPKPQDVPRYRAPKNGKGVKAPPTPPVASYDPNPKRINMENVPYSARNQDISNFFKNFKLESIEIPKRSDGTRKGVAYVILASEADVKIAISQLHHAMMKGRRIRLVQPKVSVNQRRNQPDSEKEVKEEKPVPLPAKEERIIPVPVSHPDPTQNPLADHKPSLRTEIFNLVCQFIVHGGKTPEEIFSIVTFNDEEKMMVRDCYYKHKHAQQEEMDRRNRLHTQSWGSSRTLPGQSSPEYQVHLQGNKTSARNVGPVNNAAPHGVLDSATALRLYGPKYFKENFPQSEPPIHNTNVPARGRHFQENPFHRQNAVVPTQPGVKTHCAYFLRTGHCDFAQQGCRFSHELPPGGLAELLGPAGRGRSGSHAANGGVLGQSRNGPGGNHVTEPAKKRQPFANVTAGQVQGIKISANPYLALSDQSQTSTDVQQVYPSPVISNVGPKIPGPRTSTETSEIKVTNKGPGTSASFYDTATKASGKLPTTGTRAIDATVRARGIVNTHVDPVRQRVLSHINYNRPPQDKVWRQSSSWRDGLKDMSRSATGTDGAADDEDSSSDLISLSSDDDDYSE